MRFLLVTGLSGAGKTSVNRYLEDMGAFCVDNLPPNMMFKMMEAFEQSTINCPLVAMAVDVRSAVFFDAKAVSDLISETRGLGYTIESLFLEASDESLVSRYKESRREHPLAGENISLVDAIAKEREIMQPLRETANYIIDTTTLKPKDLKKRLTPIFSGESQSNAIRVELSSFGFKRGLPRQADLVYDVRFLPNPFYIKGLGSHTGLEDDVKAFVLNNPVTIEFVQKMEELLAFLLPHYQEEGKHRLAIAIGCTGGAHRSVAIAERLGEFLRGKGYQATVTHRDLALEQAHWKSSQEAE
ncbi:MAG: RNase adapter RapZ [Clostridiales bacterium]|nr:RNase adapter RapZ [Clostridiales bacterium]